MPPSTLHNQTEGYEERNNFLYFLLGLVALAQSLLALFESLSAEPAPKSEPAPPDNLQGLLR